MARLVKLRRRIRRVGGWLDRHPRIKRLLLKLLKAEAKKRVKELR